MVRLWYGGPDLWDFGCNFIIFNQFGQLLLGALAVCVERMDRSRR
jgi:hypothetical protein